MDHDEEVMSGFLLFPPQDVSRFNVIGKKKNWQQKYCILYNASKRGIERLEIFESKEEAAAAALPRIITLENCIKITTSNPNLITIFTKSLTQQLCALSEAETIYWLEALQAVAFKGADTANLISRAEDNDLYSSSDKGVFSVQLSSSEASVRCGLDPVRYVLFLTITSMELRDENDMNVVHAVWPYKYIRRYGYRKGMFTFEAGRKCDTGEGIFHLKHPNNHEIFKCLQTKMKLMKQLLGTDIPNSPERSDLNLSVNSAVSNAPGSRSPICATRPDQLNLPSLPFKYTTPSSSVQSTDTAPLLRQKPVIKPKPQKPPRKTGNRFPTGDPSSVREDESANLLGRFDAPKSQELGRGTSITYDKVEERQEAWKTHGLDHVDHQEFTPDLAERGDFIKLISRSQEQLDDCQDSSRLILLPRSPAVEPGDKDYDILQLHFGSTSKLDRGAYKNIEVRPSTLVADTSKTKDTWNDYDEVENVTSVMQSARLADDSYLGYGVLRKPNTPGPQVPTATQVAAMQNTLGIDDIPHDNCDGTEYAIVSRAKQV